MRAKLLQKPRPKATTARRTHATDGATPTHSRCCAWALGRLSAFACTSRGCPRTDDPAHAAESPRSAGTRAQRRPPPCWHARGPALNNWAPPRKSAGENSLTSDGRRDAEGPRRAPQPSGDARDRAGCAECTSGVARRPRAREGTAAMPRRRLAGSWRAWGGIKYGEFRVQGVKVDSLRVERGDLGQGGGGVISGQRGCPRCQGGFSKRGERRPWTGWCGGCNQRTDRVSKVSRWIL